MMKPNLTAVVAALLFLVSNVMSMSIAYCSSDNTASTGPTSSDYQSNGLCFNQCLANYAFAVVLGKNCWCSNTVPDATTSTGSCSDACPGFPSDKCGNSASGLYGYIALNKAPSGTDSPSTVASSTPTSTAQVPSSTSTYQAPSSTYIVATTPTSTYYPPSTTSQPSTMQSPSFLISLEPTTVSGNPVTLTVTAPLSSTPTPTEQPANLGQEANHGSSGPSGGKIAGIVIGCFAAVALILAGIFLCWRRRRDQKRRASEDSSPDSPRGAAYYNSRLDPTQDDMIKRHNSQMSQSGLLSSGSKGSARPTLNTTNLSNGRGGTSPNTPSSYHLNASMSSHPVLDPSSIGAAYLNSGFRNSNVSLNDNEDYSRKVLTLANPD